MKLYQKACLIVAYEGISGLFRRILRKFHANGTSFLTSKAKISEEYNQLVRDFNAKASKLGYGDLSNYYWYHTIDLGNGLITPGNYDYRSTLPLFKFPEDMSGMDVLDVGSATGFFSFEFEKRGASVTSVELPSIADWDMPPGEDREQTLKELSAYHRVRTVEEIQYFHLDGPFEFCRKVLNSKVKRCHATIYDLSPQKLGRDAFDLVFIGDVLLHTFSPLKALASVALLCKRTAIISQELADLPDSTPLMRYVGGETRKGDNRTWWQPNRSCFEEMLKRLGFKSVSVVGHHTGMERSVGYSFDCTIFRATK
jgi:tRNA (mo5U34)-methyltransferase